MRRWLVVTLMILFAAVPASGFAQTPSGDKMKDDKMEQGKMKMEHGDKMKGQMKMEQGKLAAPKETTPAKKPAATTTHRKPAAH